MKFLSGFLTCLALVGLIAWGYNHQEAALSRQTSWFAHDNQVFKMNADIEIVKQRIYAECKAIQPLATTVNAPALAGIQAQLFADTQEAEDVCSLFANATFDIDFLRKLRGYDRQKMGFNLIGTGFNVDAMITAVNSDNDILIGFYKDSVNITPGLLPLLIGLRNDMDECHVLASRLKCEREPSKPIHLFAATP